MTEAAAPPVTASDKTEAITAPAKLRRPSGAQRRHRGQPLRCDKCGVPLGLKHSSPAVRIDVPLVGAVYVHATCQKKAGR